MGGTLVSQHEIEERLALNTQQLMIYAQELRDTYWRERQRSAELEQALERERRYGQALKEAQAELSATLARLRMAASGVVTALAMALEQRDPYTEGHSQRVATYCLWMGQELKLESAELESVAYAAKAHDIGKIGIPDSLLRKPGKLTESEWALMRQHPARSASIVEQLEFVPKASLNSIRQHHERLDGSGYPVGISGDAICLGARMIAVADAFDAMTTHRPYNSIRTPLQAFQELRDSAPAQYDSRVLEAFEIGWRRHSGVPLT